MTETKNQRQYPRLEVLFKIDYFDAEDFLADYASNASGGGVFIATTKPFKIGEEISFSISFPGLLSSIVCRGKVCWRRTRKKATKHQPAGIGVAFLFGSEEESTRIHNLVKKLADPTPSVKEPTPFRVLIAENDRTIRETYQSALRAFSNLNLVGRRELAVVEAETGKEAWERIQNVSADSSIGLTFDLAIVKLDLPVLSGNKLIRLIRLNETFGSLPVIATSADSDEDRQEAYAAGADLFLAQPVMLGQFFQSLQRFLCI